MKSLIRILVLISFVGGSISLAVGRSYAQDATPTATPELTAAPGTTATPDPAALPTSPPPNIELPTGEDVISFPQLGLGNDTLHGPFESKRVVFATPAEWRLKEGAQLWLDLENFSGFAPGVVVTDTLLGTIDVTFNGQLIESLSINKIERNVYTIPIPFTALTPSRSDGRHELVLFLSSAIDCDSELAQPSVVVYAPSLFVLPHDIESPTLALPRLPWPLYQNTIYPDLATLVVPDQPTAGELQAAATVAATLGYLTNGRLPLGFAREGQLLTEERDNQHLIFVGNPTSFQLLKDITTLPVPITEAGFTIPDGAPTDGLVQMAISPWNIAKAILVVGGNSDAAIIKAAQALSTSPLRIITRPDLAVIDRVQSNASGLITAVDQTFSDLGYKDITFNRVGSSSTDYQFFVPGGLTAKEDAYVDLLYTHSTLVDYTQSGLLITLNGTPIGSVLFSEASEGESHLKVDIPPSLLLPGANRISVQAELVSRSSCTNPLGNKLWATISLNSLLHLPLAPIDEQTTVQLNLENYPSPFTVDPNLSTVGLVVPFDDPNAWRVAMQIAYYLGDQGEVRLADLALAFVDNIPDAMKQDRDLIIIGHPSRLPIMSELNEFLPGPFEAGSDIAAEPNSLVVYRLPPGVGIGYLQLLVAPWNNRRAVLMVLGNTDESLGWAGTAVSTSRLTSQLAGNFAVINGEQIYSTDSRLTGPVVGGVPTVVPGGTTEPPVIPGPPTSEPESWLLPVIGFTSVAMLVVVGIAIFSMLRERRRQQG